MGQAIKQVRSDKKPAIEWIFIAKISNNKNSPKNC